MSTLFVNTIKPNSGDTITVSGSLTTTGKLTIGDQATDIVVLTAEISSSLIPDANNTYDLGSSTKYWRDLYVSSGSIKFVSESGLITDLSQDNVKDFKEGRPVAEIGGFKKSTRTKAIFQDDDTSTYKKLTVPGRIGQFISGTLVKDYNKSGSNSYSKKDGIDTYEWNSAKSMSFNSTHSFWNIENMSMDITEGGFYGLAVSGSTLASNLHNMANNTSGLFLTGSDVIVSGSTSLSGSTTFEGGDTTISQSTSDTLNVSGGNIQFEVQEVSSSIEISGSEGTTLSVSGGNVVISSSFSQSGEAIFEGGTTVILGQSSESINAGDPSEPSTLIVGSSPFTSGSNQGNGLIIAEQISVSPPLGNRAQVTSSLTLTVAEHGNGKQVQVRSGSYPRDGMEVSLGLNPNMPDYGLPSYHMAINSIGIDGHSSYDDMGAYISPVSSGSAGQIRLELPSASVGNNFNILSHQKKWLYDTNGIENEGSHYVAEILVTPNGSNTFQHTLAGGAGVQGKGVYLPSGSKGYPGCDAGTFLRSITIWCMQEATWSFAHVDGPWQDEA